MAQIPTALMVFYLDLLTLAAACRRNRSDFKAPCGRFAIIIPAHDEELLLPRLLTSCRALAYPCELFDVHVIADNCSDRTAVVAREGGAIVHERLDTRLRGKGYALRWLFQQTPREDVCYDAYVIVDADSVVDPNMLLVFNGYLASGDRAMQCYYGVENPDDGWPAMLRHVALVLYNGVRPRGRDRLGLSAGLRGNGMCFAAATLERFGWDAVTLAEDAEFHVHLLEAGIRVRYAAETRVAADMPVSLRQARTQNVRWERGRLQLLRAHGRHLLFDGLRWRDPARLDALAEIALPPLSVLGGIAVVGMALSTACRARAALGLSRVIVTGLACYVFGGLFIAREGPRSYLALVMAAPYAVWKMGVYLLSALHLRDERWLRTERSPERRVKTS